MTYLKRLFWLIWLVLYFLWELVLSNIEITWDILTPVHRLKPAVIAVPLEARSDLELFLLVNIITLTPGTLSLDVSDDRRMLFVHCLYATDQEAEKRKLKDGFERLLLKVTR